MSTEQLYNRVARILEEARSQVARTVNTAMVHAYWHVGREIVEVEQSGKVRAGYGDEVIEQLSARLSAAYSRGFSVRNLWSMRQFFLTFPHGSATARIPQTASAESRRLPGASAEGSLRKATISKSVGADVDRGDGAGSMLRANDSNPRAKLASGASLQLAAAARTALRTITPSPGHRIPRLVRPRC